MNAKKLLLITLGAALSASCFGETINVFATLSDGSRAKKEYRLSPDESGKITLRIKRGEFGKDAKSLAIYPNFTQANEGEDGFFISSFGELTKFAPRGDSSFSHPKNNMPIHGSKTPRGSYLTFVRGMKFAYSYRVEKSKKKYLQYITYDFEKNPQYEDALVEFVRLPRGAGYVEMAHWYRNHRLKNDGIKTIREKIKTRPELAYCITAPEVRILIGMKPVPTPVLEQTPETEPKMVLRNSFESVGKLIEAMKAEGVERAQVCLVGWNSRGHDGRYPQLFPVEESAGGEAALRGLIAKGKALGYQMTCHTCSTDAYSVADCWSGEYIAKNPNGSPKSHCRYAGGKMYDTCLKRVLEIFPEKDFPRMAKLGFRGLHYIDVISSIYPYECFDPNHPMNPAEGVECARSIFKVAKKYMGGAYSEGGIDAYFDDVDACLWVYPEVWIPWNSGLIDKRIPFWQLVYNGIILSTPWNKCMFPDPDDAETRRRFFEFGGRPRCEFAPSLDLREPAGRDCAAKQHAKKIKAICGEFMKIARLQTELMQFHEEFAPSATVSRYEGGTEIVCNRSAETVEYAGIKIPPKSYKILNLKQRAKTFVDDSPAR